MRLGMAVVGAALALVPVANAVAGQAQTAPAKPDPATEAALKKGKELFNNFSCGSCHTLASAEAIGDIGPSLDQNDHLTADLVTARVSNGAGPMPAFGGQLSPDEIKALVLFVTTTAAPVPAK